MRSNLVESLIEPWLKWKPTGRKALQAGPRTQHATSTKQLHLAQNASRVPKRSRWGTDFLEHPEVEIVHGDIPLEIDVSSSAELSPRMSREDNRKVIVAMPIAIGKASTPNNHGIVQQRLAVYILGIAHPLKEVGKLLEVKRIDSGDLFDFGPVASMVGKAVVPFPHPVGREIPVAPVMSEKKGRDPSLVRLEGKDHHLEHNPDVLVILPWNSVRRRLHAGVWWGAYALGLLNLLLNFAHPGHILVQLLLIVPSQALLHRLGVFQDEIED